jgi:hypothetical protein
MVTMLKSGVVMQRPCHPEPSFETFLLTLLKPETAPFSVRFPVR